jgi:protein-L-isoaspartate(D-aspartate) O-methyltransferase
MGIDSDRFNGDIDDEFKCAICCDVIEDPVQVVSCEHVFCRLCIKQWIEREASCPVDRNTVTVSQLGDASRLFRNLHSRLELKCDFHDNGCDAIIRIEDLRNHVMNCGFNPQSVRECANKCGSVLSRIEESTHNCVDYLKAIIGEKDEKIAYLLSRDEEQESLICDLQLMLDSQIEELNLIRSQQFSETDFPTQSMASENQSLVKRETSDENRKLIETLKNNKIITSQIVEKTLLSVDRKLFCDRNPYVDYPQSIGFGTTISSPTTHALVLELLKDHLKEGAKVLDIGSGSGYLTVCMAIMTGSTGRAIGIDHVPQLIQQSIETVKRHFINLMQTQRLRFIIGDGKQGFLKGSPYDVIHVGAAINMITTRFLVKQLKAGGRLLSPVIDPRNGDIKLEAIDKLSDDSTTRKAYMKIKIEELSSLDKQLLKP